jgi:hypothetical protein
MRTWMRLVLAVLLATPFTLAPLHAADPEESTEQKVKRLERELTQLGRELADLRDDVKSNALRRNASSEDLRKLRDRLAILEQMVVRHDDLLKIPTTRESGAGPGPLPAGPGNGAPASTGTITLRNQYSAVATVHINGRSYVIEPNRTTTITGVPFGTFNYEVEVDGYGMVQPLRPETLRPNGHIITIFPRVGG